MENNKDKELDSLAINNESDDEIEELLSTNSSAEDALNALLYDKSSHSVLTNDIQNNIEPQENTEDLGEDDDLNLKFDGSLMSNLEPPKTYEDSDNSLTYDKNLSASDNTTTPTDEQKNTSFEEKADNAEIVNADTPKKLAVAEKAKENSPALQKNVNPRSKSASSNTKKKSKKKKVNSSIFSGIILTIIILTVSTVIALTGITVGLEFLGIGKSTSTIKLNIDQSYSVDDIADALYNKGIINSKFLFKVCVNIKNAGDKIVPGDIELQPSMSYNDKINALMMLRQSFETVDITFPEGTTLYDAAKLLKEKGVVSSVTDFIYDFNSLKLGYDYEDIIDSSSEKFFAMEGYFFPDTYQFYLDSDNETVISTIRNAFDVKFTDEMKARAEELNYTIDEVITLASIVQLESANDEEMPIIASIFSNRLNDGPNNQFNEYIARLQSDPTSNYYSQTITSAASELQNYTTSEVNAFKDKYDTYEREGLPVGAICNPGLNAINAVLYPEDTDYYYFCHDISTKKGYYASTLTEHNQNLYKAGIN